MTVSELSALIGTTRLYTTSNGLGVRVVVKDANKSYGTARVLITPVAGAGEAWVNLNSTLPIK